MAVKESILLEEANRVFGGKRAGQSYRYEVEFHVGDAIVKPAKLLQMDVIRDYPNAISDTLIISAMFYEAEYTQQLYANRTDLLCTLYKYPITEDNGNYTGIEQATTQVYQVNLLNPNDPRIAAGDDSANVTNMSSGDAMVTAGFQLIDRALEQIRMLLTGRIYKYTKPQDALMVTIMSDTKDLLVDDKVALLGVDMYPPDVTDPRNHLIIPQGTRLVDLPNYVQNKAGGVYTKGIGSYIQDGHWFIYPVYDVSRYDKVRRSMDIYIIPSQIMPSSEVTYFDDGSTITIIATSGVKQYDPSEQRQLNEGNGSRFIKAKDILTDFASTVGNKTIVDRSRIASEFVVNERKSGLNNVQFNNNKVTDNTAKVLSAMSNRLGEYMEIAWDNSAVDLITPGIPVRVFYEQDQEIKIKYGCVLACHHNYHMVGKGFYNDRYRVTTGMVVFVAERIE